MHAEGNAATDREHFGARRGLEPVGGAPTCSVVAQEMVVNAVVSELIRRRGYSADDFKFNHPGGALGAV